MQPYGLTTCGIGPDRARCRVFLARFAVAAALLLAAGSAHVSGANAEEINDRPITTGASNGGIASASSGGEIHIGQIITGENTGNSIMTGNITGNAELHGGEIDYPTNVNVSQDSAPLIASADGGDYGQASPPPTSIEPELNVDIDNRDKNRNNNRSRATGIGEGGEGGEGGAGGNVIINGDEEDPIE